MKFITFKFWGIVFFTLAIVGIIIGITIYSYVERNGLDTKIENVPFDGSDVGIPQEKTPMLNSYDCAPQEIKNYG